MRFKQSQKRSRHEPKPQASRKVEEAGGEAQKGLIGRFHWPVCEGRRPPSHAQVAASVSAKQPAGASLALSEGEVPRAPARSAHVSPGQRAPIYETPNSEERESKAKKTEAARCLLWTGFHRCTAAPAAEPNLLLLPPPLLLKAVGNMGSWHGLLLQTQTSHT